jgi:hypothetical protein
VIRGSFTAPVRRVVLSGVNTTSEDDTNGAYVTDGTDTIVGMKDGTDTMVGMQEGGPTRRSELTRRLETRLVRR